MIPIAKADYSKATVDYPSVLMGEGEWRAALDANEDIMWMIIRDVYDAVKTEQEKDAGIRRMGRRPARHASSMDEVWATVFPARYTQENFQVAFTDLVGARSQRAVAIKVGCNQATVSRLLSGQAQPDALMMERIATGFKIPATFFTEYRALAVGSLITRVMTEQPHLGIAAVKRLRQPRPRQSA